jgi:hypothetical protein
MLARLTIRALEDGVAISPGNNVGYHGSFDDLFVAAGGSRAIGEGCLAGISVLGIEADGTVKGCPSLPRAPYAGHNIRTRRLREMLDDLNGALCTLAGRQRAKDCGGSVGIASLPFRARADVPGQRNRCSVAPATIPIATTARSPSQDAACVNGSGRWYLRQACRSVTACLS